MPDVFIAPLMDPARRPAAGAIIQDEYDLDCPWHVHDMHQLQYAFEGAIEVEDERARHLLPRQLAAWIPAGVAHRTSLHRVRSGSILFTPEMVPEAGGRVRIIEVTPLMREMVLGAMRWPLLGEQDNTARAYFTAMGLLCSEWLQREAKLSLPTTTDPRLKAAMEYTREHLLEADMAGACRAAGMSERSLRRRIQHVVGMTWEAYRRRARLLAAVPLLGETDRLIGVIATDVGFESQSAFAKAFRSFTGKSPLAFRRR